MVNQKKQYELYERHKGLVLATIKRQFPSVLAGNDRDDYLSSAYIALWQSCLCYGRGRPRM